MNQKIIYNYKQYVNLYSELLNKFLLIDIDYEEIDFLEIELRNYRAFYANTITDYKNDREYFDVENNIFIVDNCSYPIVSEVSEYANKFKGSYDNEGYDLLAFKFKKIIEFLEQKKHIVVSNSPSKISDFLDYNDEFENVKSNLNDQSTTKEKIEFIINSLIDFSNKNKYDYRLYKSFAEDSAKSFDYYLSQIDSETDKEKIISDLKEHFHFSIRDIVTEMLASTNSSVKNFEHGVTYYIGKPIPDTRIGDYENNYKHLIEYFFNATSIRKLELEKELNLNVPVAKDVNKKNITANQLALMMVYEGNTVVTREEHGNDLYNKVMKWAKVKTRTANDGTNLQLENKIRMFEVVIELLDDRYKQKAIDEVKILKSYLPKN